MNEINGLGDSISCFVKEWGGVKGACGGARLAKSTHQPDQVIEIFDSSFFTFGGASSGRCFSEPLTSSDPRIIIGGSLTSSLGIGSKSRTTLSLSGMIGLQGIEVSVVEVLS
jgi:hypothetical protein